MLRKPRAFRSYPKHFILVSALVCIAIYALGAYVLSRLGTLWLTAYLLYILWLEYRVLRYSCRHCYYYGKNCSFGRGKICAVLFKKGDPKVFIRKKITWQDILPDFLTILIPLFCGVFILVRHFSWPVLIAMLTLFFLGFMGNAFVRGTLACRYCKQRELGCPAEKLFNK